MITLSAYKDNTFTCEVETSRGTHKITCYLLDARKKDGTVYIMKRPACLKAQYTADDKAETERLNSTKPLKTGDVVLYDGRRWTVKMRGDYMDAGRLVPVKEYTDQHKGI